VRYHCCPAPLLPANGLWWLLVHFEKAAWALGAKLLWGASGLLPPLGRMPTLLTVHDLVYRSLPWTMSRRNRLAWGLLAGRSISRADWIWAVSRFTAGEIRQHYPQRRARELVVGSGLNPLRAAHEPESAQLAQVRQRYGVNDQTLLFVGTLEPRTNLRFLLALMPVLAARGFKLVVVGCTGWGSSGIAELVQTPTFPREAVLFCDYVSDADLQCLYHSVALFVSTSLMEGFGLPQLEAMAAGCPVVAAANSALVEVVGDGGQLVIGWSQDDWLEAIFSAHRQRAELGCAALQACRQHTMAGPCKEFNQRIADLHPKA
jgi:glycosyltransferase involved in cell wall biosynthesis